MQEMKTKCCFQQWIFQSLESLGASSSSPLLGPLPLVRVFILLDFLLFNAPPPVLRSLAALTCWPRVRGDVKVKKSQAPASAHLPETLGLIWELLAENLPNGRKLGSSAAGRITAWERGCVMQNSYKHEKWGRIWKEGSNSNVSTFKRNKPTSKMTSSVHRFGVCCIKPVPELLIRCLCWNCR